MQSQTVRTPTGNDIRAGNNRVMNEASAAFYVQQCEQLVDLIQRVCDVAKAGERVDLVDQWGHTVSLVLAPNEGSKGE